jgi:mannosyl-3-phosphoglycerate synthase
MRIELPREVERFGAIRFGGLQKVFELDSGLKKDTLSRKKGSTIRQIPYEDLYNIENEMAIVVPIRNERLKLIEGVLSGIPHQCLIIIVSNSPQVPVDRFAMEKEALRDFCIFVNKNALIVHQKDRHWTKAFKNTGYTCILDKKGEIRDGKAEGMIIGTILAKLAGKKYVGFVDADNYFPGAVSEYIHEYAAAFALSKSRYSMVRIAWHSKPKITQSKLFFRKWGRTSENTNRLLNKLISNYTGYETEILKTGNAGEHALTLDLAMMLEYSTAYSVEPYHIVNLMEKFGGISEDGFPEVMKEGVEVYQIESRNPHLHEAGDVEHVDEMSSMAMQVIYHSHLCEEKFKKEIVNEMVRKKYIEKGKTPSRPSRLKPLNTIDLKTFMKNIKDAPCAKLLKEGDL